MHLFKKRDKGQNGFGHQDYLRNGDVLFLDYV